MAGDQNYSVDQIVGKTLYPLKVVGVYDLPDGNIIGTIQPHASAGVVYSYIQRGNDIWWMFDSNGTDLYGITGNYYIKHKPGLFDVSAIRDQGAITVGEQKALEAANNKKTTLEQIGSIVKWVGGIVAAGIVSKIIFKKK